MNLASQSGDAGGSQLLFANFNQDNTSLAVGTKSGYKFFSLSSVDKLEQIYECTDTEDVCIVERLFSSSLVAIVSLKAPRKLKVCHFKKGTEICNYSYSNTILAVKLNRQRLIVCLEESLYIHNIRDMKVLHTIRETPPNPSGLCALSISNDNCYLAYPGSATIGEVQVFDTVNLRAANMIPAHDSPLAALAFDASGTKLATASEKGTVIRVFSIPEGQKLFEFRRGVKRCVSICSLAFSMEGLYLSASSNTETVHIFKLETQKEKPAEEPTTWGGYLGKVLMASTTYLPSQVTEMFTQGRAFATVRLPFCGHKNICALAVLDGSAEPSNEILEQGSHDRPLVAQTYSAAVTKGICLFQYLTSCCLGYCEEQGAVGGAGLEDDLNDLRLEEENEQPPLILETD
uniref:WD repeat domain, phosphoinositide interacting 2 n=1 Tax=Dicentrarchus labrax TaxID=13489 RepID=A0A8C4DWH9_DICLA